MIYRNETIFVGQGSNRESWNRSVARGQTLAEYNKLRAGVTPETWAERESARLALTGKVGQKLGALLGITVLQFSTTFRRFNLNKRFNGKSGRGDAFDSREGAMAAVDLQVKYPTAHFVILGKAAALCFGLPSTPEFLEVTNGVHHKFLVFPHPSGLNQFWNDKKNTENAVQVLREFVGLHKTSATYIESKI